MTGVRASLLFSVLGLPLGVISLIYAVLKSMKKENVQDKVVLITGASSGIGEACAEIFYEAGCKVILSARRSEVLEKVKKRLDKRMRPNCHSPAIVVMDLENLESIPKKVDEAIAAFGHIDIVINNAGVGLRGWSFETSLDVDEKLMKINYFGPVQVIKSVLPHMIERKSGHLVAVSSIQGLLAVPERAAYGASKHALEGFCQSIRPEVSLFNIKVSMIYPYYVRTNLSLNALCGDGSTYQKMDVNTAKGMDPRYVAKRTLECVRKNSKECILAPFHVHLGICLRTLAPWLIFKIMNRKAKNLWAQSLKNS